MPRSGTTLIEQILSSHPDVFGGGELNFLEDLIKENFDYVAKKYPLGDLINTDIENLKRIGREYVAKLKNISDNSERVTDKLPINFKWIGFIKLILPNSKIIHCVRNPRDNCLSIFKNYFVNPKLNFAYNLKEISDFYVLYRDLMKYWKTMLPRFIFDFNYEKITQNPDEQIHSLLKICNLNKSRLKGAKKIYR